MVERLYRRAAPLSFVSAAPRPQRCSRAPGIAT
jgi:hypothetical protein